MYVIEFQKCGLPHTHMLVLLHPDDRPNNIEKIDGLVSAEIPYKYLDPIGYNIVKNYMIHGPCGKDFSYSPCTKNGKCIRNYPKSYIKSHTSLTLALPFVVHYKMLLYMMLSINNMKNTHKFFTVWMSVYEREEINSILVDLY